MRLKVVCVLFAICTIVNGAFWAAAAEPVVQMLGLGSVFAAWNIAKQPNHFKDFLIKMDEKEVEDHKKE